MGNSELGPWGRDHGGLLGKGLVSGLHAEPILVANGDQPETCHWELSDRLVEFIYFIIKYSAHLLAPQRKRG